MSVTWVFLMSILLSMFLLTSSPISLGVLLFLLSLLMVVYIGLLISSWYAYMLFLVYVGGLLVMFIYICMISSNSLLKMKSLSLNLLPISMMILMIFSQYTVNHKLITYSGLVLNGVNFPLLLLLMLGVYLLVCFISVINIIFAGGGMVELEN